MTLEHVKSEVITCIVDDCLWPKAVVREWQLSVRSDPSGVQ